MDKTVLLINPTIQPIGVNILKDNCRVEMAPNGQEDTLIEYLNRYKAEAIITRLEKITRKIIESSKSLKIIGMHGVGLDHIDVDAATQNGVMVLNVPDANYVSVAEHAIMFVLSMSRNLHQSDQNVRDGNWMYRDQNIPMEVAGKRLLIIGLGRVGQKVASLAHAFDMKISSYDTYVSKEKMDSLGVEKEESLAEGIAKADFISIHAPLTPETRHMFSHEQFKAMKKTAYLLNLARGPLVDEAALYEALKNRELAGAALDVFEQEPPTKDNPLLTCENLIVTPHIAGDTMEAKLRCSSILAQTVVAALKGEKTYNIVNLAALKAAGYL